MTIPPHRAPGDLGHISDHNSLSDTLSGHAVSLGGLDDTVSSHLSGADPHGDRAYADSTKAVIGHTHNFPVSSVNGAVGVVVLTAANVGAETPAGAQTKVDTLGGTVVPLSQKGVNNGVATLDGAGKIPSAQLPAGSGVTSVNGFAGAVTLTASDVGAVPTSQRGAANGVATLDAGTLVPTAQIPTLDAAKIGSGTLGIARIPTGVTSSTVSLGDHAHTYPVTSVNSQTGAVVLAAADVGALATAQRGAASGVASLDGSTLVPVAQIPSLDAAKITTGVLATGRIPDLSTSYMTIGPNNNPQVASNATTRGWGRVDLNYAANGSTPDSLSFYYGGAAGAGGTRTGYHNEYGELRGRPAQTSTVALRAMGHTSGSSGDIFQVTNFDSTTTRFGVSETAAVFNVPLSVSGSITSLNLPPFIGSGTVLPNPAAYLDGAMFMLLP